MDIQPSLDLIKSQLKQNPDANTVPVYVSLDAAFLNPISAYLKLTQGASKKHSFLLQSAYQGESIGRYSMVGTSPRKVIVTGAGFGEEVDPLIVLEKELKGYKQLETPGIPSLSGGALGYISYDCIKYFEPKTARPLKDNVHVPEALFMLYDTVVAFDHVYNKILVITNLILTETNSNIEELYENAKPILSEVVSLLSSDLPIPLPDQPPIEAPGPEEPAYVSNIGQQGYEAHVTNLKKHIHRGDIIQAVPSQRLSRRTNIHPFNIYRELRGLNPSPYMFYIDCDGFQLVGASPELLVQCDRNSRIVTHPIAGTVRRGKTPEEDDALAQELRNSLKDRAEHVMLVDLARNDVNRVCDPATTVVDRLMTIERFSHVMHLTSQVSGTLRPDKTRFDAFRSIFPAGTVSGAPKVKAMELIGELEGERRGVYAGAVGHWGYASTSMDTCIALRTMMVKDGVVYLQAGGGIVYDSDEYDEYVETLNKLKANVQTVIQAEQKHMQSA
ncbi:hypothetical protein CANCADRAFT_56684 [Tortispora caseinolytica NRRL Y-17796]|uniref:anthranilate synthase n=1 Tax=Tortispora caseinolytica NRRL Y-17796 TaxID=767744 RepID=A0A1E4TEF6_9ASCO|nr:hypothetical protein CANCADRAFT_56684 [Tortispora caseinolytica NRRL Y-17796]